ncbi:MAG: SH3 domain-containing protein [Micavibrio sp.]|nr:SH3 domain-containing protein [Micavibrio sp.]
MRLAFIFIALTFFISLPVRAQEEKDPFHTTPYPLPRFVSLGSGEVAVRTGPGFKYPILWMFTMKGLPVEIILEYDNWRKVRDFEGQKGWVHQSLLSGKRNALVKSGPKSPIHKHPSKEGAILAYLEPSVILPLDECVKGWCKTEIQGHKGWVEKTMLFGVYEAEKFD